jgi:uncharacterized membrane protein
MVVSKRNGSPASLVEYKIELSPNCSLTPASARLFIASLAVVTFPTAGYFALRGFWPILAIAILEIVAVWWAVQLSLRAGTERETILVSEESVVVEQQRPRQSSRVVFPRHWATVKLRDPQVAQHPSRLLIESHGRACEVGRFLTEEERRGLAGRLRQLVGKTSESPVL